MSFKRGRRRRVDGGGKKETEKLNTSVEVQYVDMIEALIKTGKFRNKTHVVEIAIEKLYDDYLGEKEKEEG
jgi:Arc/MetJ-type ribon-helix-helix transcriptional regulator